MATITPGSSQQLPMLSLAEIKAKYPDQWVLVIDPELDEDLEIIQGKVVYNTHDKQDLYDHLDLLEPEEFVSFALEYTGDCSDQVVIPWL